MKVLNYGSVNVDKVYDLEHFVREGETVSAVSYSEFPGGKGLNQSVALKKAGMTVSHLGAVGKDGGVLKRFLSENGVEISRLIEVETATGHAVIQRVNGKNCIIVFPGANHSMQEKTIGQVAAGFEKEDIFLTQNETAHVPFAIKAAKAQGMRVAFNASPVTEEMKDYPLSQVDYLLVNEVEARALAGEESQDYQVILKTLHEKYPSSAVVMTVGADGVYYQDRENYAYHPAFSVETVDTTAAGDTFCGYFIDGVRRGMSIQENLRRASMAGALAVSRKGAAVSIPETEEVDRQLTLWKEKGEA